MTDATPSMVRAERTVAFRGREVVLYEVSLRTIKKLAVVLRELLPGGQAELGSGDPVQVANAITALVENAPDKLAALVVLVAPTLTVDEVLDATARDVVAILVAAWELNNIMDLLKKVLPGAGTPGAGPSPTG